MPNGLTTRMLVLGVVSIFEPANGYQIRRELASWQIEEWADVKIGSVYSMLTTLTKQGLIVRHDLTDGGRPVAVYALTTDGRTEFARLVGIGLDGSETMDRSVFQAAISFAPLHDRSTVVDRLQTRLRNAERAREGLHAKLTTEPVQRTIPPSVRHFLTLDIALLGSEVAWLQDTIEQIREGSFTFSGEADPWTPPPDDAGWETAAEARRYREQLAQTLHPIA